MLSVLALFLIVSRHLKKLIWKRGKIFSKQVALTLSTFRVLNFSENAIKLIHSLVLDDLEGWGNNDLGDDEKERELLLQRKKALLLGAKK